MAFDASVLQYMEDEEWRLLTAVELGHRNHDLVATALVQTISGIRGTIHHFLGSLVKNRLLIHEGTPYDGYQLTKNGYDFLALHTLTKRGTISSLGSVIGQGKEADVYSAFNDENQPVIIKFHRVGRVSFRKAKDTREYLSKKHSGSWLYLSRLSAQQEFNNMTALQGFKVPKAIDWNRHAVVMSLVPGILMNHIDRMEHPDLVFERSVEIAVSLLKAGVVHGDFSQFNLMVNDEEEVTVIDFPQCLKHTNPMAEETFNHDMKELCRFFEARFGLKIEHVPVFSDYADDIVPIELDPKKRKPEDESEENEEEEQLAEDDDIRGRVSKEYRYKRKVRPKKDGKSKSRMQKELDFWD